MPITLTTFSRLGIKEGGRNNPNVVSDNDNDNDSDNDNDNDEEEE